jgi:Polyketide cyclase / dehydrase and lipid transport
MGLRESASARVDALPEAVLSVVTSVSRLPEWNPAITEVVEAPERLEPGTVWRVRVHALGQSWVSKSEVIALDPAARRFAYRSQSDDGNPSYADWEWHVEPDGDGSRVTVTVDLNPLTFWRKHLLIRIRRPALRKEMQESLAALGSAVVG